VLLRHPCAGPSHSDTDLKLGEEPKKIIAEWSLSRKREVIATLCEKENPLKQIFLPQSGGKNRVFPPAVIVYVK
jgi:hypothetical protein